MPAGDGGFVALPGAVRRLLETPRDGFGKAADRGRMVPDATCAVNDGGAARAGPDLAAKAVGFGPPVHERGPAGQLVCRQAAGDTGRGTVLKGLGALHTGTFHPLADGGFADAHGRGDLALGPTASQEFPGLETSGCFPVVR
jgi:hypothetical protein